MKRECASQTKIREQQQIVVAGSSASRLLHVSFATGRCRFALCLPSVYVGQFPSPNET